MLSRAIRSFVVLCLIGALSACGAGLGSLGRIGPAASQEEGSAAPGKNLPQDEANETGSTIWDAFRSSNSEASIKVNRYIWQAALDVLSFMPLESVDPFSGVIVFGYGNPPGSSKAYRATVYVKDPALDARSLNVALAGRAGPVAPETQRAVEDAILNRARQMRIADSRY